MRSDWPLTFCCLALLLFGRPSLANDSDFNQYLFDTDDLKRQRQTRGGGDGQPSVFDAFLPNNISGGEVDTLEKLELETPPSPFINNTRQGTNDIKLNKKQKIEL